MFLCGDVMTGRGIDQILPHPCDPVIYEPFMTSAEGYVKLAEAVNGPIRKPVDYSYIWGDALRELERAAPDVRIINLETTVTTSDEYQPKGINYRMNPGNISCITAAGIGCCCLANNHVLDWGLPGLVETLETVREAGMKSAGAGRDREEAETPAVMAVGGKGRVILFSFGSESSGIPPSWAPSEGTGGVNLLTDLSDETVRRIGEKVAGVKRRGDVAVASIHWGGNWGYEVPHEQRSFARRLIDEAGVDVVYGHSSHHAKGIEVYRDRLILYGCGDFINDYEGIGGYEPFRADLGLMYFVSVDVLTGKLISLRMTPTQIRRLRVNRASRDDARWLREVLNREGQELGTRVDADKDRGLTLLWD
jgi:poly-gamma-glutamate synthesis protein (capsule biosynthesis protein)